MKPIALLLLALMAAPALSGCSGKGSDSTQAQDTSHPALAEGKGAITGLVIDDRYRPVPDALVLLTPGGLTATTDSEGQFQFTDLLPGAYLLQANAPGHEAAPKNVDVKAGEYAEAEVMARRVFSTLGAMVTTEYSVFISCAASVPAASATDDCTNDQSGDSDRGAFTADYRAHGKNVTYLITEMKANRQASPTTGALKIVVRDSKGGDPYFANKFTTDSDYIKVVMSYGNVSADDNPKTPRNQVWKNKEILQTALFPQGALKGESQTGMDAVCPLIYPSLVADCESRGLGAQVGTKAKFVQTLFIGPPTVDIATYAALQASG